MMNGYPYHSNGKFSHHDNNVPSQIYPPISQNFNLPVNSQNYSTQVNNMVPVPTSQSRSISQLPPYVGELYMHNQDSSSRNFTEPVNSGWIPGNCNYSQYPPIQNPGSVTNTNLYNNVQPKLPLVENDQTKYLQPLQQHNTYQTQQFQINPSTILNDMKNLQLNSQSTEQTIDLMQTRNLFSEDIKTSTKIPKTCFTTNCEENIMQCTLNTLPIESNMLTKCRLPLGVHIQPFRDANIMLVQTNTIVRCRNCRTYINPFVTLSDHQRRWHCNVCARVNDIPDEFMYDSLTKTYGSPTKRPELQYSNIEYTANPDYTVRPPMATMYVFCLEASQTAISSGYLRHTCELLIENLDKMPGDSRRQIAFLTYNSSLHYYQIQENSFKMMLWSDVTEVDVPVSEDLLVNLNDRQEIIVDFLRNLPSLFTDSTDNGNCFGFAIQVAMKLITHNGGRITVINASMPNVGPGSLSTKDNKDTDSKLIQPSTDFYKSLSLQCANDQISVDLFCINRQYSDIASIVTISRHSSGGFYYYGHFQAVVQDNQRLNSSEQLDLDRFTKDFRRYLTRKIGFEAVMRTRSSKGLDLTAFYGNLFMRSTNVIALPVVSPDASYAIQFKINGTLSEWNYVIIQAALLYTTSESDRRIRVHTMCLPLTDSIDQLFSSVNSTAIAGLIAKIAIDKCLSDGLNNVREAFVNSLVDPLKVFNSLPSNQSRRSTKTLLCPLNLCQLAPFVLGLLRNPAFRDCPLSVVDGRVAMLECLRWLPLTDVVRRIYPRMVAVHQLAENIPLKQLAVTDDDGSDDAEGQQAEHSLPPTVLSLTSAVISRDGAFLVDVGECFYLFLGNAVPSPFLKYCFAIDSISQLPKEGQITNFDLRTAVCRRMTRLHRSIASRSLGTSVMTVLPDCSLRTRILNYLVEDRMENAMSYYEFLKSIHSSVFS